MFHNEVVEELLRMTGVEQSLTTAYSSEENGIVENGQNLQTWLMESGSLRIFTTLVVAQHNEQEFVVEPIVGHSGNRPNSPHWNSRSDGQASASNEIAGNPTRHFSI